MEKAEIGIEAGKAQSMVLEGLKPAKMKTGMTPTGAQDRAAITTRQPSHASYVSYVNIDKDKKSYDRRIMMIVAAAAKEFFE